MNEKQQMHTSNSGRGLAIAELLRMGYPPQQIRAALAVTDKGDDPRKAMLVLLGEATESQ